MLESFGRYARVAGAQVVFASDEGRQCGLSWRLRAVRTVVTDNPGCIMHLRGWVDANTYM